MSKENEISMVIPPDVLQAGLQALTTFATIFKPYLKALTKEERKTLLKMGDKSIPFVEKVIEYTESEPEFVPPYMNAVELKNDFAAFTALNQVFRPLTEQASNVNDTMLLTGHDAYKVALQFYNYVKQAAKNNVPNAKSIYEELKKRFEGQGKTEPMPTTPA